MGVDKGETKTIPTPTPRWPNKEPEAARRRGAGTWKQMLQLQRGWGEEEPWEEETTRPLHSCLPPGSQLYAASLCGFSLPFSCACRRATPVVTCLIIPTHHHRSQPGPGEPLGLSTGCNGLLVSHTLVQQQLPALRALGLLSCFFQSRRLPGGCFLLTGQS